MADLVLECESCHGKRFKADTLEVKFHDMNIYDVLETVSYTHLCGNQGITILARILNHRTGGPLATAADGLISPLQSHLTGKLID